MRFVTAGMAWVGAVLLLGVPGRVAAQRSYEITGFGGSYQPTNRDGMEKAVRDARRQPSWATGGRLTVWTTPKLGFEVGGGYSPARVSVIANRGVFPRSTELWFGSGKVLLNVAGKPSGLAVVLGGGLAALHSNETVLDPVQSQTNVGGVGSVGLRFPLGPVIARGDVEDYLYNGNFGRGKKLTQDLMVSAGFSIKL